MPWCVKSNDGRLWDHAIKDTSAAAIDFALGVFSRESAMAGRSRLANWNWLKRWHGLRVVRVMVVQFVFEGAREPDLTRPESLAMAILRGDRDAALALADLVLETYHAAK
jgi:hypothetical protein